MVLRAWLTQAQERLSLAGIESARLDAELLATHVLGAYRAWVLAHPDAVIDETVAEVPLQRREQREPLAYVLGWREFYGRRFEVRPQVLIPRQETEILVEAALQAVPDLDPLRVLDLGTGSGCIAITLKLERPEWRLLASDVSASALAVAAKNNLALKADVSFVQMDALGALRPNSLDLILSNPPYIADREPLMPEVADHEPALALRAGEDGLDFYRRLSGEATRHLVPGGRLLLELGAGQAQAVTEMYCRAGWRHEWTVPDLAGIPRVAAFAWPA